MIDAKEAKRLQVLEETLVKKFREAQKNEQPVLNKLELITQTPTNVKREIVPLSVSKAKHVEQLQTKLQNEFADIHQREIEEMLQKEKEFEPITRAIKEQKSEEQKKNELRKNIVHNQLARTSTFRPRIGSTPSRAFVRDEEDISDQLNDSMKQLVDTRVVNLGSIGYRYFPKANDKQFGIWYDEMIDKTKIGSEVITFDYDDIILVNSQKRYKGTEGLWRLLTSNTALSPDMYTKEDWAEYKDILVRTNALYQRNDPKSGRPKSSQGQKYKYMIKDIWKDHLKASESSTEVFGSGLAKYNNKNVEYKYINNLNELINRLNYIAAQEEAGNNNFHNEKLSLVKFVHDRMEELVETPKGVKYLIRCMSALPEHAIEGSGLLNDLINKLPFELHAPRNWNFDTYNYCGPGTKLQERLARGDKGINPLDEACKKHDIWYRDHKKTEDRWVADKELQKAAWNRVTSADADLNERGVALATSGGMWLKRKLGMGLGTSACMYY